MGFMLFCSRKRSLASDIMSENPNKKIKLDFQNQAHGNEDLWDQDDAITAEEFDMLEIQATQSCSNQNCSTLNNTLQTSNFHKTASNSAEVHNLKQLQYELEGRVKLLSFSLEKSTKELNEERLNREQIINKRMKQFHEQESHLKKEIEKMKSILEFKEQEMKSTYSKLQILKSQCQDKKSTTASTSMNSNFDDFLKSNSKCNQQSFRHNSFSSVKQIRKYKLPLDVPKGEVNGAEILSFFLCSRLSVPSSVNKEHIANYGCPIDSSFSFTLDPLSVLHLKNEQKSDEIVEYYSNFLKNHINMLKALAIRNNQATFNNSLPGSIKTKEAYSSQTVISYLSDIVYLYSSPSLKSFHKICDSNCENSHKNVHLQKSERESSSSVQQEEKLTVSNSTLTLFETLLALSNPETYPNGYHKDEEMEFAMSALLSVYSSHPKHFLDLTEEISCYFFSNPHQSITGLCITIKLLTTLCPEKNFPSYLVHKDNNCIFCLIADFLHVVVPADPEKFALAVILVEDFLSTVFSIHNYKDTELEASNCISKVIQGLIKSAWKYFQMRETDILYFEILKKGFLLLHFMSSCIPSFKEKRSPVEDEYISLISGILAVSKEKSELRKFYDLIHNMWDFQTDISEFDLDELSEEAHFCTNNIEME